MQHISTQPALSLAEAAQFLNVSRDTVRRLVIAGKIPARRIGVQWRISVQALHDYLNDTKPEPDATPTS